MTLTEQQRALLDALTRGAPVPDGFDHAAVQAGADALLRKRCREVARQLPLLQAELGPEFRDKFLAWARNRPKTTTARDARDFAAFLAGGSRPRRSRWWRQRN